VNYHAARSARNPGLIRTAQKSVHNRARYTCEPTPRLARGGHIAEVNGKTFVVFERKNGGEPIVVSIEVCVTHRTRLATPAEADAVLTKLGMSGALDIDAELDALIARERRANGSRDGLGVESAESLLAREMAAFHSKIAAE
jgi:hypothetical protein